MESDKMQLEKRDKRVVLDLGNVAIEKGCLEADVIDILKVRLQG